MPPSPIFRLITQAIKLGLFVLVFGHGFSDPLQAGSLIGSPPYRVFSPPEADVQECSRLLFDQRGMLLAINHDRVWEFDGHRWKSIEILRDRMPLALAVSEHHPRVYMTGFRDIGYIQAGSDGAYEYVDLRPQLTPDMLQDVIFVHINEDADGHLYVGNLNKIYRFARGQTPAKSWPSEGILSRTFVHEGKVHGSNNAEGVFVIDGDEKRVLDFPQRNGAAVSYVTRTQDGRTLLALDDGQLALLDGERLKPIPGQDLHLSRDDFILGMVTLPNGWFAANSVQGNLLVFDLKGQLQRRIGAEQGLRIGRTAIPTLDKSGQLWLGSSQGVLQVDILSPISVLDRRHRLGDTLEQIWHMDDRLWVGDTRSMKYSVQGENPLDVHFADVPGIKAVESNYLDHSGRLLFCSTRHSGLVTTQPELLAMDPETFAVEVLGPGGASMRFSRHDPNELMLVGLESVIRYRYQAGRWQMVGKPLPTPIRLNDIYEGAEGEYWLTSGVDSVMRLTLDQAGQPIWKLFGLEDGLPQGWIAPRSLAAEVIFCTKVGIYRWNRPMGRFEPHPDFRELPAEISAEFLQIQADQRGNLWFAASSGTGVMRRQTDGAYTWDLLGLRMLGKPQVKEILFEEPDIVWMSTRDSIIRYDDRFHVRAPSRFSTIIREIRAIADGQVIYGGIATPPTQLTLPYARNYLRLQLATTSYVDPKRTEYSHWLEGRSPDWSAWSRSPEFDLPDIAQGEYTLHLRARNVFGQKSDPISVQLTVLPPWYRTWWAYLGYGLGGVLLVLSIVHLRSGYLRRKNIALQRLVDESTEQIRHQAEELANANASMARANEELTETNEELGTTNQRLIDANHRLEELDREKNEFIGIVSHDLRNPLGAITQAGELLDEEPALTEQGKELLGLVRQSADMSLGIVTNLLDLNRIEQGRLVTELKAHDLSAAAHRAVDFFRDRAREKHIELLLLAPDPVSVQADPNLLEQVLSNLVSNAVKYSPHGRRVWVVVRKNNGQGRCEVRDEGHGIRPEEQAKLFKKFSRLSTKPTGGEQSVGLGLAIVQRMVEAMNGRIWCESVFGKGATFIVELATPPLS